MDLQQFRDSLTAEEPPSEASAPLQALWYDAKGDWQQAHRLAQREKSREGAWVHAYLHRVEGDLSNAGYWYREAGKPPAQVSTEEEWMEIVTALL